ncbi:MAG: hypothetical protein FWH03_04120 [Firmicutes bacterium]|nr:hypothetical protein [Bacillota bacterium]
MDNGKWRMSAKDLKLTALKKFPSLRGGNEVDGVERKAYTPKTRRTNNPLQPTGGRGGKKTPTYLHMRIHILHTL